MSGFLKGNSRFRAWALSGIFAICDLGCVDLWVHHESFMSKLWGKWPAHIQGPNRITQTSLQKEISTSSIARFWSRQTRNRDAYSMTPMHILSA